MKLKAKRILSALLCLCMLLGLLPASALATVSDEVAVTIGGTTTNYPTLADGISALKSATAEDEAVLTILKDINLSLQRHIASGVFTIDLNGCKLISTSDYAIILGAGDGAADVTITDSGENGLISAPNIGIYMLSDGNCSLTIESGTIQGGHTAICSENSTLNVHGGVISGGSTGILTRGTLSVSGGSIYGGSTGISAEEGNLTITGGDVTSDNKALSLTNIAGDIRGGCFSVETANSACALSTNGCESLTISGGTFEAISTGNNAYIISLVHSNVTISGGTFIGNGYDIYANGASAVLLTLGENDEGATFPGGITVENTTLSALLGAGAAYWQENLMITPTINAKEITGGDVTVKAVCTHENANLLYAPNGEDVHTVTYSCCGYTYEEEHALDEVVTPPTCTEDGYTTHSCSLCGWSYVTDEIPAEHSYGEDNICTICGAERNLEIVINMADRNGDGWNGSAIEIYIDGELAETITVESDQSENTYTFTCDPDKNYEFLWLRGSYTSECSFEIFIMGELVASAAQGDCYDYADGYSIYSTCEHVFGEETTAEATCTEGGYVYNACTLCGRKNITEELEALGHDYDANGICTRCGHEAPMLITITMADSYGDGWNGNAIEIYIDGELTETLTIESNQSENTYTFDYDPNKEYEFLWAYGSYASECSFKIFIMGNLVASAAEGDCSAYVNDNCIYSTCEHIFGEEITQAATCTEGGCVYRACTLCGRMDITEKFEALGHDYDANGICTRCGQDIAKIITIAMKDSYGDGWGGNAIEIYVDGELEETVTIAGPQFEQTYVCTYDPDKTYEFLWVEGAYVSECSFEIFIGKTLVASAAEGDCYYYEEGDIIYTTCEHIFGEESTMEATCTEGGCVYRACTLCGRKNITEKLEALGHDYDANGICTRCGLDISNLVTITMENIHGDGWHGSGIVVYIDGEFYEFATMEDGDTFTWSVEYDPEKVYEFYWHRIGVENGCGFTIRVGVEAVFETDDIIDLVNGDLLYSTDMDNYVVYVGGVELGVDQYLDLNGNVSAFEPTGGYAFYDGRELTLNNYSYTGEGKSVPVEGYPEDSYLIYSTVATLKINLIGENTLSSSVNPGNVFGISMGSIDASIVGNLSIGGEGTLNLNVAGTVALHAYNITIYSGTININAFTGIYSSIGGSTLRVYDGELNINASGHDYARAIDYSCFELSGGKVVLSSDGEVALDVSELNVGGGYLEVKKGGMRATANVISFNESVSVVEPEGAARGSIEDEDGDVIYTILTADGEVADAFIISDGSDEPVVTGWTEFEGQWYYIDPDTYGYATGMARVPYPTEAIGGITYAPDQEALDYYEARDEIFIDAEQGWFLFNEYGALLSDFTGIDNGHYYQNGFMTWNTGLIEVDGEYYMFLGDIDLGGNTPAIGNNHIGKNTTDLDIAIGGVYTFNENGKLCEYDGITEIDGKLWYYEDAQLMLGKGLIALNGNFYYVRSDGSLVVGQKYWVEKTNNYKVVAGEYEFDEDGKLLFPNSTEKHGIYFEKGGWYYYENGKLARGKGLINTLLNWYDANGKSVWGEGGIIYVRSDGRLATGRYYISNIKNFDGTIDVKVGMALNFNDMGMYIEPKNGIYEVDGILRYFINDVMQYGSGIVVVDEQYYYVRSNGVVVSDCYYWITNVGSSGLIAKEYYFDENGVMQDPEFVGEAVLNGIADGYYYEDGKIAYNKGLTYLEAEGCYVYVRSNGKIALGKYWITNHNNLLPAAMYDFGADGKLYK